MQFDVKQKDPKVKSQVFFWEKVLKSTESNYKATNSKGICGGSHFELLRYENNNKRVIWVEYKKEI